ncbi:tetratricopeptide repeat protein [Acetonema longum]|uniref:Heat shock protein DnaJ domain-containing protein n=1 Tax=Acetonema longum DSM 6540 TaxID=1009370 RepID=F7NEV6_9FIRM|nr:tetratricopeptide repeat protein [Acetonema longum]EGO65517.1 heat shock protein DnaJ domain-containing protein [Acetonema longum DSM 6540]
MKEEIIWQILGINKTKDPGLIRGAYRTQLLHTNPEDDAQGFINLRKAYEEAIRLSSEPAVDEAPAKAKSDMDLWLEQADDIYQDIRKRREPGLWEKLLSNDVCQGLDTWLEAREKLLAYIMDHYYLPHEVWLMLDRAFDLIKNKETLLQSFSENFIEYVINQIQDYSQIDLNLLTVSGDASVDDYMRSCYNINRLLNENQTEAVQDEFNTIDTLPIYHPYADAQRLRYFISLDHKPEIEQLIPKLAPYLADDYIAYIVAKAHAAVNHHDEAASIWEKLRQKWPAHYSAQIGLISYDIYKGRYKEANERAVELLRAYPRDEDIHRLLVEANEHLIKEYEAICQAESANLKVKEDLAWCYYQNNSLDQCIQLLAEFPAETSREPWFLKIHSYVYLRKEEFKKALDYSSQWLELLKNPPEDGEGRRDLAICYRLMGACCFNEKDYEQAIPYLQQAASLEENSGEKLDTMQHLSSALLRSGKPEACIDVCDEILKQSKGYYPAYINRQEAHYNMRNGQEVIDDYYKAIEIYPSNVKPYLLAAKVFYFNDQYEDAFGVINRAREAKLESNELELLYGKCLRFMSKSKEEEEAALQVILALSEKIKDPRDQREDEFHDLGEVLHELAKAYANVGDFPKGLETMEAAIQQNPQKDDYHFTKAYLYVDLARYEEAIIILERLIKTYPKAEYAHTRLGRCYEETDNEYDAIRIYRKTLEINPDNLDALEKLGDLYIRVYEREEDVKHYETARRYGEHLLELRQDSSYYYVHVGIIYDKGYQFAKALECYQKAVKCNPKNLWPHNNAGYVLKNMKKYDEAIGEYQKALELMEPGDSLLPHSNLATCFEILGRYEEALDCYREILKHWPDRQDIHEYIAAVLAKMGKPKEAVKVYQDLIKKYDFPKEEACYHIMQIYEGAGQFWMAFIYACNAVLHNGKSVEVLKRTGMFYFSIGKYFRAKSSLKKAIANAGSPKTESYYLCCLYLAQVYFDEGKTREARQWATQALSAIEDMYGDRKRFIAYKPYGGMYHWRLGMIYLILGEHRRAEYYFTQAVDNLPCKSCHAKECFDGYYGLGRLYEEMKQFDRAEEYYKKAMALDNSALYKRHLSELTNKKNNRKDNIFKTIWRYL